jgi:hypothetical protein
MHPYENADAQPMTYLDRQRCDADEVLTSAPALGDIPAGFDPERTWDGSEEEGELDDRHRADISAELIALYRRNARLEILLEAAERRASDLEEKLDRSDAHGLLHENLLDLLAEVSSGLGALDWGLFAGMLAQARGTGLDTSAAERRCMSILDRLHGDRARIDDAWGQVRAERLRTDAERERAAACVRQGLAGVSDDDLVREVNRRFAARLAAAAARIAASRPVPASAVVVARDDAGDDAAKDAS